MRTFLNTCNLSIWQWCYAGVHHMVVSTPVWHCPFLEHQLRCLKRYTSQQTAQCTGTHNNIFGFSIWLRFQFLNKKVLHRDRKRRTACRTTCPLERRDPYPVLEYSGMATGHPFLLATAQTVVLSPLKEQGTRDQGYSSHHLPSYFVMIHSVNTGKNSRLGKHGFG